jgi:hypothetical protein
MKLAHRTGVAWIGLPFVLRGVLAAGAVASATMGASADDAVSLQAKLGEGLVLRYDVDAQLEVRGAKEPLTVDQKLRLRFTVAHADKDGAVVRCKVESAKVHASGADADFEWKEGDEAGAGEEPVLARLYRRLGAAMMEVSLDEHGVIKAVSGLDGIAEDATQVRELGILAPDSAVRMLQGVFSMDGDGHSHKAGEHWTWAQDFPAGVWMASMGAEYTLKSIAEGIARVQAVTTITPRAPREGDADTAPRLEITAQSIKTDADWDVTRGRLVKRATTSLVELKNTLPLQKPIVAPSTSRSKVVFTLAGEGPRAPKEGEK